MAAKIIPLHQALRHLPAPGALMSLDEVRAHIEAPPPCEVAWRVFTLVPRREVTVMAQRWWDARLMGALQLGMVPERVSCIQVDEVRIEEQGDCSLEGSGVA